VKQQLRTLPALIPKPFQMRSKRAEFPVGVNDKIIYTDHDGFVKPRTWN